ncbi:MAG TPA: HU family DNA-binding protein [Gammaproteobacteria bacterium]|nr:HU family DNA-binding protein [Gammaproteobacteria bacterium]
MAARKKGAKKAKSTKRRSTAKRSTTKRKSTARKSTAKKGSRKKKASASASMSGPLSRVSKVYTKGTLLTTISERTGLPRKDVGAVLTELTVVVEGHLKRGGPGQFTLPGMLKMKVKNVPAKKARKGINPFTGEPTTFKAKPASRKVRVTPLKALKEMAL